MVDHSGSSQVKRRPSPLVLGPCFQTVGVGSAVQVDARGGVPPYRFFVATNSTGATVNDRGQYVAGLRSGTDGLQVFDVNGVSATVNVQVSKALTLGPQFHSLHLGHALQLVVGAGVAPFRFDFVRNNTASAIDAAGLFTAGSTEGTDTVSVTDATGATSIVDVTVSQSQPEGTQSCPASQLDDGIVADASDPEVEDDGTWVWDTDYTGNYEYPEDSYQPAPTGSSSSDDGWENSSDPQPPDGSDPGTSDPNTWGTDPSEDVPPSVDSPPDDPPPSDDSSASPDDSDSSSDDSGSSDPDNKRAGKKKHTLVKKR